MYNPQKLLMMIDTAVGGLIENEVCSYCLINYKKDERCKYGDFCRDLIFAGLEKYVDENFR